jgi:hypothetical protein
MEFGGGKMIQKFCYTKKIKDGYQGSIVRIDTLKRRYQIFKSKVYPTREKAIRYLNIHIMPNVDKMEA